MDGNVLVKQGTQVNGTITNAVKRKAAGTKGKLSFSVDQIKRLYKSAKERNDEELADLIFFAMHTGARIEELCQLKGQDFKVTDGCHYIDIHGEGDTQNRVKTPSSIRKIPVHSELINLGLLDVVNKRSRECFLFNLKRINTNLGHLPSKWFSGYKASLGLPKGTKASHSFRHTLRDKLTLSIA